MGDYYWNSKIDYLSKTRSLYYNDDYLEFLVKCVWKITSPVRIIDFGCGYGYLGTKFLPLIPEGSTYTGVDAGNKLIDHAKELFAGTPFKTEFILGDVQKMSFEQKYDIVVCHAFLLHVENPKETLQKMLSCLVDQGRIICFEPHWISAMANYYLDGYNSSDVVQLGFLQELFERDSKRSGKDGNIGIKLPVYLSQLGVKQIECRVSDKVNFLDPYSEHGKQDALFNSLKEDGFGAEPGAEERFIANLVNRGATCEEALKEYRLELFLSNIFQNDVFLTYAANMKITTGVIYQNKRGQPEQSG
ncbi:class I SAM-dependent methyltransferase [Paenibacillus sp. GCM10023248]|uniref:class I SAM-dependent methyltransferase n=1 Tax=Bacillales TaxID=1385 RepID=UPI002378B92B|nr:MULTISPECIES: class I SAM-dependent methyltransferase [Bacillales]MDD9267165.1 class I SAM-dependent methyltransferase [Paenibacillus sp. MAHUQ-63]MDR6881388.1 SAM-dependent methyltransferase [Bacillus sp. 3255]